MYTPLIFSANEDVLVLNEAIWGKNDLKVMNKYVEISENCMKVLKNESLQKQTLSYSADYSNKRIVMQELFCEQVGMPVRFYLDSSLRPHENVTLGPSADKEEDPTTYYFNKHSSVEARELQEFEIAKAEVRAYAQRDSHYVAPITTDGCIFPFSRDDPKKATSSMMLKFFKHLARTSINYCDNKKYPPPKERPPTPPTTWHSPDAPTPKESDSFDVELPLIALMDEYAPESNEDVKRVVAGRFDRDIDGEYVIPDEEEALEDDETEHVGSDAKATHGRNFVVSHDDPRVFSLAVEYYKLTCTKFIDGHGTLWGLPTSWKPDSIVKVSMGHICHYSPMEGNLGNVSPEPWIVNMYKGRDLPGERTIKNAQIYRFAKGFHDGTLMQRLRECFGDASLVPPSPKPTLPPPPPQKEVPLVELASKEEAEQEEQGTRQSKRRRISRK